MLQDSIRRVDGLYKASGEVSLDELLSLEKDVAARVKLLAILFGTHNFQALCRQLSGKFARYLQTYQEHLAHVQRIFAECVSQLNGVSTDGRLKETETPLLAQEAIHNRISLDAQFIVSWKYYLSLHSAPLARFKCLSLGKIVLASTQSQLGLPALYPKLLKRKQKHIGFLYSLMQKSVPEHVDRSKVLKCEAKTWLPGAAVGDKNWIQIVKEWGESGPKQKAAARAFFNILCLSNCVYPDDVPKGIRPEKLLFDREGIAALQPSETPEYFVQRATIREVYEKLLKFPANSGNINKPFVIRHAKLCEDIEQQEWMRESISHIVKDFKEMPKDFADILAKCQSNLQANRQRLMATFEGSLDSPQHVFLITALLVAHLRSLSLREDLNTEELFEQIYSMDPGCREELFSACTARYYAKKIFSLEGFGELLKRYTFSSQQCPFLLLHHIVSKNGMSSVPESKSHDEELIDFVAMRKFIENMEFKCRTLLPTQWAFLLLNGQFISRRFADQMEDFWVKASFIRLHHDKPMLPAGFMKNVLQSQANLEAEAARLKQTLRLGTEQQKCLEWLVEAAKWASMHPKSHELIISPLYHLPLPAESYPVERQRALSDNGRLVELLPGFRLAWWGWQCHEEGYELHMRIVDNRLTMGTFAINELLPIPKAVLDGELVDLIIRSSPIICNDWFASDNNIFDPKTPEEALQRLNGCQDLQNYMNRNTTCKDYGLKAARFLFALKVKLRNALIRPGEYPRESLNQMAARGNVQPCPGGLCLVPENRNPAMGISFQELKPCLKTIAEGKEAIVMLQGLSKAIQVKRDTTLGEAEIHLSIQETALSLTAKWNLNDTDEDKLRYLAWLMLMLKAKWFAKMIKTS